jgi:D-alanyl-lipoteichoic acid acyltransferase DltB (MBOAT superfamily)
LAATPSPQLVHYLFFLPVLVVGPIHRLPQFTRDIRRHRWDANMFVEGIERIIIGYAKVALLAAFLVNLLDTAFTLYIDDSTPGLQTYTEMILIGISLYFTFSGYSDVAIGFARLLGFRVMENFDSPYLKPNISAFWASWHISLTSWSREYVYNSVVSITRSPGLAAMASLVVIGLWHDISWQYLLWGLYHGSAIFVWQRFQKVKLYLPAFQNILLLGGLHILSVLMTIHFVFLGFLLVRQEKFGDIIYHIKALIGISI